MTTPPDLGLRSSLHRVADTVEPLPVADDLWQRGQAARRRGRVLVVAAALAALASLGGVVTLVSTDREVRTATAPRPNGGAIPSTIKDLTGLQPDDDLAVGRASVAFVSDDDEAIVVTARDGRYHEPDLPGWDGELLVLSPDGTHLSWTIESDPEGRPREGFALLDLESGDLRLMSSGNTGSITPDGISWAPSSRWLTWFANDSVSRTDITSDSAETSVIGKQVEWAAVDDDGLVTFYASGPRQWATDGGTYGRKKMAGTDAFDGARRGRNDAAIASPDRTTVALSSRATRAAVDFLGADRYQERTLATDLYPEGAVVRPLGWATDTLVLAQVDGPPGSYVEGPHLALFSAPNVPERQWTYRMVSRDIPDQDVSVAVDLVPDLDGTSSQALTHDFDADARSQRDMSWVIGLGVAAAIAVLMGLRWLWRRLLGRGGQAFRSR